MPPKHLIFAKFYSVAIPSVTGVDPDAYACTSLPNFQSIFSSPLHEVVGSQVNQTSGWSGSRDYGGWVVEEQYWCKNKENIAQSIDTRIIALLSHFCGWGRGEQPGCSSVVLHSPPEF